jgi:hypothetical protein
MGMERQGALARKPEQTVNLPARGESCYWGGIIA